MSIADQLRTRRVMLGMTQEQVAIAAGMNITQYNGYERGRSRPSGATLERLAAALQTDADEFTTEPEPAVATEPTAGGLTVQALSDALREAIAGPLGVPPLDVILRVELRLPAARTSTSGLEGAR